MSAGSWGDRDQHVANTRFNMIDGFEGRILDVIYHFLCTDIDRLRMS